MPDSRFDLFNNEWNTSANPRDAGQHGELNGNATCNIVNRTLLGMGAQLELSKPLRDAMFTSTAAPGASTPPPSCSGPSWRRAATRSTASKPSRSSPGPIFGA
jgi:hypothetical protein